MIRILLALALMSPGAAAAYRPLQSCACDKTERGDCVRSSSERLRFLRETGWPKGRPGFQADHMVPICCGGADRAENMQWLRVEEKRLKDSWELDCSRYAPRAKRGGA